MSLGAIRHRRIRRPWLFGSVTVALAIGLSLLIVSAGAVVAPSGFEGNDGNMAVGGNASPPGNGTKDWASSGFGATHFTDPTSNPDDALGQGSKEDDLVPVLTDNGAPPKDDFKDVGNADFLYESSIRVQPNGSANLNVEFNQGTLGTSSNGKTPIRVVGDKLITFDFTSGGSKATITELTWSNSGGTCGDANDSPPCWVNQVALSDTVAEGASNDGTNGRAGDLTAAQNTLTGEALKANRFQEMSINLTAAGILPVGVCKTFALTQIKSRSSGSTGTFNSALKDLVIANRQITNCGAVNITKVDDAGSPLASVKFDLYVDDSPFGAPRGTTPADHTLAPDSNGHALNCTTGADGKCSIADIPFGHYWVVEDPTTIPAGHNGAPDQAINVTGSTAIALNFINPRQPGSIDIHKQDDTPVGDGGPNALANVTFTVYKDVAPLGGTSAGAEDKTVANTVATCTTDSAGDCPTITGVQLGQYWVVEGTPPTGYSAAADQLVVLSTGGQNVPLTFTDPRKHRVIVIVCHEGTNDLYSSNVTIGSTTSASIAAVPGGAHFTNVTEADLCGIGGASFGGLGHGSQTATVSLATH